MTDLTPNLGLPFILPSQAQKHVTHNEALRLLDVLTQMTALSQNLTTPPDVLENGAIYLVPGEPSGPWLGQAGKIAVYQDGAWIFISPKTGWRVFVVDANALLVFDGTNWVPAGGTAIPDTLGINATADSVNRLAVRSDAVLFNNEAGDIRAIVNKSLETNTGSFVFQTGFSARAEIGLTGSDDFHFKVSADGSAFHDGIVLNRETGLANFPNGFTRNGVSSDTLMAVQAQLPILSGPTSVGFDAVTQRLNWTGRFVTISAGYGAHYGSDGFFDVHQPAVGTTIPGFGGALDDVVTADGCLLGQWEALYYRLPIGAGHHSQADNFRRVFFMQDFSFPDDEVWVFLALRNGDTDEIRLGNGKFI